MPEMHHIDNGGESQWLKEGTGSSFVLAEDFAPSDVYERVEEQTRHVLLHRNLGLNEDVYIVVPEHYKRHFGMAVGTASILTVSKSSNEMDGHVMILNGWTVQRLHDEQLRDLIAHELAHAAADELHGSWATDESSEPFKDIRDAADAPPNFTGYVVPEREDFYEGHP